jgi:hypothetical protein
MGSVWKANASVVMGGRESSATKLAQGTTTVLDVLATATVATSATPTAMLRPSASARMGSLGLCVTSLVLVATLDPIVPTGVLSTAPSMAGALLSMVIVCVIRVGLEKIAV